MQAQLQSSPAARTPADADSFSAFASPVTPSPLNYSGLAHTTGLAHDAGNLLGALGLYCDLLRAPGVLRPEHHHYASELSLISSRSCELIRRLLKTTPPKASVSLPGEKPFARNRFSPFSDPDFDPTLYRPENTFPRDQPTSGNLAGTLRDLAPILSRIAAGSAQVTVAVPNALPPVSISPEVLERITVNLVRNAAEAIRSTHTSTSSAPEGRIVVTLAVVNGRLQLSVDDNGPGLPSSLAASFLHPSPLPSSNLRGLGHRIIHELVSSTAGQLAIRTRPGEGTRFCLKWSLTTVTSGIHPC